MSQRRLHVCQICGKKFATPKGVCGHQRMHSGLERVWCVKDSRVCSVSMTENEKHEVIEAAMNLVLMSQRVYDFAAIRNLLLGDVDDDFNDAVARALPCTLRSELQKETQFKYQCSKCDKSFKCSQALGGHQRLHRLIKGQLESKMEEAEDSLFGSSEGNKIVLESSSIEVSQEEKKIFSQPSSFDVSQELKLDYSEVLFYSGYGKSSRCSKTEVIPLRSTKSHSSYRFKICGKSFLCSQALSGHKTVNRFIKEQLASTEGDNSLFSVTDVEASKSVSQTSSFKIQQI